MNQQLLERVAENIIGAAFQVQLKFSCMLEEHERPCVVFRPRLFLDGDSYCALLGDDIMVGCAGFGRTVDEAMRDFDKNFYNSKAPTPRGAQRETKCQHTNTQR